MKNKAYAIFFYATIALIGGIIGFAKTGSKISIISAAIIAIALDVCGAYMMKGKEIAYKSSIGLLLLTLIFFGYRFALTSKMMPAGVMILLTIATLGYLLIGKKSK